MANIGSEIINSIVTNSEKLLKQRTLGGVNADSAANAIKNAAEGMAKKANELLGSTQKEIESLRSQNNLSAQKIAELTSQKDKFELSSKAAQEEINTLKSREFKIKQGKPKTLPNGNIETIKINKNGARMTTETLPDGRKVSVTVETIDGDIRKTTFNPATGKPIKTFTNTNGKDLIIEYDADGKFKKLKEVNNKKVRVKEPTVVSREILETKNSITKAQKTYSDGSYEILEYNASNNSPISANLYNKDNKLLKNTAYDTQLHTRFETVYNAETGRVAQKVGYFKNGIKITDKCDKLGNTIKRTEIYPDGFKREIIAEANEFGTYNVDNPKIDITYPKTAKIKKAKIKFRKQFYPETETLQLRDGTTVILSDFDGWYNTGKVTIKQKGAAESKILTDPGEIKSYLASIGKVTFNESHYYNSLL